MKLPDLIDGGNRISLLIRFISYELAYEGGGSENLVGMALRPDVYKEFMTFYVSTLTHKQEIPAEAQIMGVPYVVFGITAITPDELGKTVRWAPEVTFFTDGNVWKRFLQHTDD